MVTDKEKEEAREQAKRILGDFAKELEKVKFADEKEPKVLENSGIREISKKKAGGEDEERHSSDFREKMFENAPEKDGDFLIAEKKKW